MLSARLLTDCAPLSAADAPLGARLAYLLVNAHAPQLDAAFEAAIASISEEARAVIAPIVPGTSTAAPVAALPPVDPSVLAPIVSKVIAAAQTALDAAAVASLGPLGPVLVGLNDKVVVPFLTAYLTAWITAGTPPNIQDIIAGLFKTTP